MDKKRIVDLLLNNDYKASALMVEDEKIDFGETFIKDDKEAYIVIDKIVNEKIIEEYKSKILWFQNWCMNEILLFNINLIILYKNNDYEPKALRKLIAEYERDSSICRKIFIDIEDESDLDMIPFNSVIIKEKLVNDVNVKKEIVKVVKNEKTYQKLTKLDVKNEEKLLEIFNELQV
ncbi:MAG: hypothetical protein E6344_18725 [Clostridium sp.]|nr:hypothetical protein [Clostridium sp.]MDU7085732.1 hypothetical protein [Clostridium sp.]